MLKGEFIAAHRDRLAGLLLDAMTEGRKGAEAMAWLRLAIKKIDHELACAYDALVSDQPNALPMRKAT